MKTCREWTIYWAKNELNPYIAVTKVKGPLLFPKETLVVVEKERLEEAMTKLKLCEANKLKEGTNNGG